MEKRFLFLIALLLIVGALLAGCGGAKKNEDKVVDDRVFVASEGGNEVVKYEVPEAETPPEAKKLPLKLLEAEVNLVQDTPVTVKLNYLDVDLVLQEVREFDEVADEEQKVDIVVDGYPLVVTSEPQEIPGGTIMLLSAERGGYAEPQDSWADVFIGGTRSEYYEGLPVTQEIKGRERLIEASFIGRNEEDEPEVNMLIDGEGESLGEGSEATINGLFVRVQHIYLNEAFREIDMARVRIRETGPVEEPVEEGEQ